MHSDSSIRLSPSGPGGRSPDAVRAYILDMLAQLAHMAGDEGLRELESLLGLAYRAALNEVPPPGDRP